MKIVTVVGVRPQFIKSAPVSKALREFGHTRKTPGLKPLDPRQLESIFWAYTTMTNKTIPAHHELYGDGDAGCMIVEALVRVR